jgi:thiol:disulfide interchange protein
MKRVVFLVAFLGLLCVTASAQTKEETKTTYVVGALPCVLAAPTVATETKYAPVEKYDPARNACKDIRDALAEAKRSNRRVLLEVGGLWCVWCRHMDSFFDKQPASVALREKGFVTVKVNWSEENKNEAVLSQYPKIGGFPHLFVLDANGALVRSQDTGELEEGKGYSVDKFNAFLLHWATAPAETAKN